MTLRSVRALRFLSILTACLPRALPPAGTWPLPSCKLPAARRGSALLRGGCAYFAGCCCAWQPACRGGWPINRTPCACLPQGWRRLHRTGQRAGVRLDHPPHWCHLPGAAPRPSRQCRPLLFSKATARGAATLPARPAFFTRLRPLARQRWRASRRSQPARPTHPTFGAPVFTLAGWQL